MEIRSTIKIGASHEPFPLILELLFTLLDTTYYHIV